MKKSCCANPRGFTLIEVLVVVIIIAVLAAVALPQYQKAVLKSRFSSLMPTTKAVRDGNEAYYMAHGGYASAVNQLDVTATNSEDMTLEVSRDLDYSYVLATRPDLNEKNNLIMYQQHSAQFPGEIHCEALADDTQANWLCQIGMHATQNLGEVISEGYNTYVIEGTGSGLTPSQMAAAHAPNCDKALAMGAACSITEATENTPKKKEVCYDIRGDNVCVYTTFDENDEQTGRIVCSTSNEVCYEFETKDGKEMVGYCFGSKRNSTGTGCTTYSQITETYVDENGKGIRGLCTGSRINQESRDCTTYSDIYETYADGNGKEIRGWCMGDNINQEGTGCATYINITETYTDGNGNEVRGVCSVPAYMNPTGTGCTTYNQITETHTDGNNREILGICHSSNMNSTGTGCTAYDTITETYIDEDGNKVTRECHSDNINATGTACTQYESMSKSINDESGREIFYEGYYWDEDHWELDEYFMETE